MITKPEQHEIDRAGKRMLREALESLGWVVNEVEEDYGIDFNVQVFDGKSPTGTWFHVQLKSSASSEHAADGSFVSQELSIDHARHYALELREPVFLIHADAAFSRSALQICKAAASICAEAGDSEGVVFTILSALMTTHSEDSDAYRWATQVAQSLVDPAIRAQAFDHIERATKRWRGEKLEGDYLGDAAWQIIEKIASALGINLNDQENAPLVRGLRIAAKDNNPERVLARCEHIIVTEGATGPTAREIWRLFNTTRAASKVVHCTLHNFHVEGKDLDTAYAEFKRAHCDSCPDQKPRPGGWRYTKEEEQKLHRQHREFVAPAREAVLRWVRGGTGGVFAHDLREPVLDVRKERRWVHVFFRHDLI